MEPSKVSEYHLRKTLEASQTSYNLLMLANLMRRTAGLCAPPNVQRSPSAPESTVPATDAMDVHPAPRSLSDIRVDLFFRHGARLVGAATKLGRSIESIQAVKTFSSFLVSLDVPVRSSEQLALFLRQAVHDSADEGYSKWPLTQQEALAIRLKCEPDVEVSEGIHPAMRAKGHYTFFTGDASRRR